MPEDTINVDTTATNSTAVEDTGNRYNICQRTGFKVKPGELLEQWDNILVRPESFERRHDQEFIKLKAERLEGAIRPEPADVFISTSVAPEDL